MGWAKAVVPIMWGGMDLVVVSWHTMGDLRSFVQSYDQFRPETMHTRLLVFLVEATDQEIREAVTWGHDVMWERENVGYNVACNIAAQAFAGEHCREVIAFFNADTELRAGVLEGCHRHLMADESVGIVGPRQINTQGRLTSAGIDGTHAAPTHRGWMQADEGQFRDVIDCVTVSGSAYFVRRDVLDLLATCSIFRASDPDATGAWLTCHHYYSETFLSYHAAAHGFKVRYVGDVPTMIHQWHKASLQGGIGEQRIKADQAKFRAACDDHKIIHN